MQDALNNALLLAAGTCAFLAATAQAQTAPPVAAASAASHPTQAGVLDPPPPVPTPKVKRLLRAMGEASTWGHPDLFGQFAGIRHLYAGEYVSA